MYDAQKTVDFDIRFLEDFSDSQTERDSVIENLPIDRPLGWRLDMKERLAALKNSRS
jgi:hypothetical protein